MDNDTLVLGDDGSIGADLAWRWIMAHRWPGWRLDVVMAVEAVYSGLIVRSDEPLSEWDPPTKKTTDPQSGFRQVRHLTKPGDPRAVLDDVRDADLLVLGAVGLGSVKTLVVGSTADYFLHNPSVAVALVRSAARTETVWFCVDGSAHAQRAVEAAAALPWISSVRAQLLTVDDGRSDNDAALETAMHTLRSVGVEAGVIRERGRPTHVIMKALENAVESPLVVLGTRGLTTLRRLWLGSTAAAVAHHFGGNVMVASDTSPPA